jgi:hypothetical protein
MPIGGADRTRREEGELNQVRRCPQDSSIAQTLKMAATGKSAVLGGHGSCFAAVSQTACWFFGVEEADERLLRELDDP